MKILQIALTLVLATAVAGCGVDIPNEGPAGDNYMEYEGRRFLTSRQYNDWDEFKEDPNNFLDSETQRMADAVRAVQFLPSAFDRDTVMKQMLDKQFPGFGCGGLGLLSRDQLDSCAAFFVEIPRSGRNRYVGYAKVDGRFKLVADFEASEMPMIAMVGVENNHLIFYGMDKSVLRVEAIKTNNRAEPANAPDSPRGDLKMEG